MSEPVICLSRLGKAYGQIQAVEDLSLSIEQGTIFGFLGANGAGKTTTMRMLCGLVRPSSGHATIAGVDVWRERQLARSKFGYVAQRFSLYRDLTVEENIRSSAALVASPGANCHADRTLARAHGFEWETARRSGHFVRRHAATARARLRARA